MRHFSVHATGLEGIWFAIFWFQASQDKKSLDVGANLFIGNLDPVSHQIMQFLLTNSYVLGFKI